MTSLKVSPLFHRKNKFPRIFLSTPAYDRENLLWQLTEQEEDLPEDVTLGHVHGISRCRGRHLIGGLTSLDHLNTHSIIIVFLSRLQMKGVLGHNSAL